MPLIEPLDPAGYRRIPWKNGRGELVVIDGEGGEIWANGGIAWHFGRTAIVEEGPFSDYTGYERLQVVIKGAGLVLVAPDHEIDLRAPMRPQRYDGGTPVRVRLEQGPVQVVNLIADRAQFEIDLRVVSAGGLAQCMRGSHLVYAPVGPAQAECAGRTYELAEDQALRVRADAAIDIAVRSGQVLIGSIHDRP